MTEFSDEYWMMHALKLAQHAFDAGEVPVGAVLVLDEKVIGEGWNLPIGANDPSAHAEIRALRAAGQYLQNYRLPSATLYVTIEPCTMCLGAIIHARVARVVFGATEPKAGVLQSHQHILQSPVYNHQIEWRGGVLAEECSALIQSFFKQRRAQQKIKSETKKKTP